MRWSAAGGGIGWGTYTFVEGENRPAITPRKARGQLSAGAAYLGALEGISQTINQRLVIEGLAQETACAGVQDPHTDPFVARRGHENNGRRIAVGDQPILQVGSAHARHPQIGYQARRVADAARSQIFLSGGESGGNES